MFGLIKRKNPYEQEASALYHVIFEQSRQPVFYADYGVPDTIDGRFDLLLVHIFIVLHHLNAMDAQGQELGQALFDMCFADMDQAMRNRGVGDMGVPKHMRRMMKAFNGRMHAYEEALEQGTLEGALIRNLYGTVETPNPAHVKRMANHMQHSLKAFETLDLDAYMNGAITFPKAMPGGANDGA